MSEQAAPAAAPAAAPSNGAPPPSAVPDRVHAGDSFEDFQAQVQARMKAQQQQQKRLDQPPAPPKTVHPEPKAPPEQQAPLEPHEPFTEPPQEPAPEQQQATDQQHQWTQEDIDLLAKAKEWMASDKMPEEFIERLVELKNGDEVEYETWEEVKNGRLRQKELTRSQQKFDRDRADWESREKAYQSHFEAIFNDERDGAAGGDAMYEIFSRAGKFKQLWALGQKLANIEQQLIDGANGMGYATMQRLGIKDPKDYRVQQAIREEFDRRRSELERDARNRAIEFENQRLKQAQQQTQQQSQNEEFWAAQRKSLEQLRPRAFEALGMNHENPLHRQKFDIYLDAVIRQEKAGKVTPELVMKAARAAMEELQEERKAVGAANGQKPKTFQPQLSPGGGGRAPGSSGQSRMDADAIAEKFGFPRW